MIKAILTFIFIFITGQSFGEYRVYQYIVKNKIKTAKDIPNGHYVLSTLNPVSYVAYNGGSLLIDVDLLRTWMCPGHTGKGKDYCPSPYDKIVERTIQ